MLSRPRLSSEWDFGGPLRYRSGQVLSVWRVLRGTHLPVCCGHGGLGGDHEVWSVMWKEPWEGIGKPGSKPQPSAGASGGLWVSERQCLWAPRYFPGTWGSCVRSCPVAVCGQSPEGPLGRDCRQVSDLGFLCPPPSSSLAPRFTRLTFPTGSCVFSVGFLSKVKPGCQSSEILSYKVEIRPHSCSQRCCLSGISLPPPLGEEAGGPIFPVLLEKRPWC